MEKKVESTNKADTAAIDVLNLNHLLPCQLPWIQNPEGALAMTIEL